MKKPMSDEKAAYEAIKTLKVKFGVFHKVCFHVHTPESHDYRLLHQWSHDNYRSASEQDVLDICIARKLLPANTTLDQIILEGDLSCYEDKKTLLSYFLLAETIMLNKIEVVLEQPHKISTITGTSKPVTTVRRSNGSKRLV